jgi:signal transduction histidine kinase
VVLAHALGHIESTAWGYRDPTMGFFMILPAIAHSMWRDRRLASPHDRLRSRTSDAIMLLGFAPLLIIMPLWTFLPELPQISYLQNMALGLASIPTIIIVARSAHYQLHEFWWRLWLALVAAVLALVAASLLVLLSGASASVSLAVMLVVASWVVYLLRGWLERRLIGAPPPMETFLPQIMSLQALEGDALEHGWRALLDQAFAPKSMVWLDLPTAQVGVVQEGEGLVMPALGPVRALLLTGASRFTRSFGHRDHRLASSLHALAHQGLQARAAYLAGAVQERLRIAADLHDDIGGKLLHLASVGGSDGHYARNTLEDLRTITRGLSALPRPLPELLADIHYQLDQRADRASLELDWHAQLPPRLQGTVVGSRQSTVLVSICSELLRNAMQHQGVSRVRIELALDDGLLRLECSNDGAPTDPSQWHSGLGTTSIRRRVHDLQGQCEWRSRPAGGAVFLAHWPLGTWLQDDPSSFGLSDGA